MSDLRDFVPWSRDGIADGHALIQARRGCRIEQVCGMHGRASTQSLSDNRDYPDRVCIAVCTRPRGGAIQCDVLKGPN